MKLAIFADPYFPVPPQKYGGTHRSIANLIWGLQKLNVEVTLFGAGDSTVGCEVVACCAQHLNNEMIGVTESDVENAIKANYSNIEVDELKFDVIHWMAQPSPIMLNLRTPLLITPRIPYSQYKTDNITVVKDIAKLPHSSISLQYQKNFPGLNYVGNVYNGMDIDRIPFSATTKNYIAFVGRFSRDKQPHLALKFAIEHGLNIKLAGKIDKDSMEYFEKECRPMFDNPLVDYVGEVNDDQRNLLFGGATVNLHLLDFEEPFGLTIVEAGLTGTPTIAFSRGSMPEIIDSGESGFIANSYAEIFDLYKKALILERCRVRKYYEKFSMTNMASEYLKLYNLVIASKSKIRGQK